MVIVTIAINFIDIIVINIMIIIIIINGGYQCCNLIIKYASYMWT